MHAPNFCGKKKIIRVQINLWMKLSKRNRVIIEYDMIAVRIDSNDGIVILELISAIEQQNTTYQ